ncbi:MAG: anti-sigma factor [Candidatus Omnitrophota bacterium]
MRCRKIQELLKTDYLDGEVNQDQEQLIRGHLAGCPHCRGLEQELQSQRVLFQGVRQQEAPERVWQNIREKILTEGLNQEERLSVGVFERLRNYLFAPKPIYVLARALAVIIFVALFAGTFLRKSSFFNTVNYQDSFNTVYSLDSMNGDILYDFGTSIEEYFL